MTALRSGAAALTGALQARGLFVAYGEKVAVRDLTLTVAPGQLVAVTGPSGAGKSSLLWALAGALPPAAGTVWLGTAEVRDREQAVALGIALVPQGNALAAMYTASENIILPLLAAGVEAGEARSRAEVALHAVGLEDSGRHLIEELSGGQQQRVAVARALAARAVVLLADEPTSDLDSLSRGRVVDLLRAEADRGARVVMTTHDPEAAAATDAEAALDEGVMSWARR